MISKTPLALRLALVALLVPLFAGWGGSWSEIRKTAQTITSVRAAFVQKKSLKILSKPLISQGTLSFQAPGSLRWEYSSPVKSILLIHDGAIKRYLVRDGKLVEDAGAGIQAMQVVVQEIGRWLKGEFENNPTFAAELKARNLIVMTPREPGLAKIIQRIELKLAARAGAIETVRVVEGPDSATILEFRDVAVNQAIPASVFRKP